MKGRAVTKEQKKFHDALCSLGCVACWKMGIFNAHVSVHHPDGRTKPWAHWLVLALCGPHHQHDATSGVVAVHPFKAEFESRYGKQDVLLLESLYRLESQGYAVPKEAWEAARGECYRMSANRSARLAKGQWSGWDEAIHQVAVQPFKDVEQGLDQGVAN